MLMSSFICTDIAVYQCDLTSWCPVDFSSDLCLQNRKRWQAQRKAAQRAADEDREGCHGKLLAWAAGKVALPSKAILLAGLRYAKVTIKGSRLKVAELGNLFIHHPKSKQKSKGLDMWVQ